MPVNNGPGSPYWEGMLKMAKELAGAPGSGRIRLAEIKRVHYRMWSDLNREITRIKAEKETQKQAQLSEAKDGH